MRYGCKVIGLLTLLAPWSVNSENMECGSSPQARELARIIQNDTGQQRPRLVCHPLLSKVAEEKARTMADYGIVRHNLGGSPNQRLRDAGFRLPEYYGGPMNNQVEAVAGGYRNAEDVWFAFRNSDVHRKHLLGEHPFYKEQDLMGVGFYKDYATPHIEYWAVYITEGHSNVYKKFDDIPNKGIDFVTPANDDDD